MDNRAENEINGLVLQVSNYLIERLPINTRVSLMNISESELDFTNYILERVSSELVDSDKLTVVARNNLKPIEMEQQLGLSGAVSDETAASIGKYLGAEYVISSFVARQNGKDRLFIKAVDAETTQIKADRSFELVSLSIGNFSKNSLPVIEKLNTNDIHKIIIGLPKNLMWGIGIVDVFEPYELAMDRASANIAESLAIELLNSTVIKNELKRNGLDTADFLVNFLANMAINVSRNVNVERRFQSNDGRIWYFVSLNKEFSDKIISWVTNELRR